MYVGRSQLGKKPKRFAWTMDMMVWLLFLAPPKNFPNLCLIMTFGLDLMISLQKNMCGPMEIMFPSRFGILASQMVQQGKIVPE